VEAEVCRGAIANYVPHIEYIISQVQYCTVNPRCIVLALHSLKPVAGVSVPEFSRLRSCRSAWDRNSGFSVGNLSSAIGARNEAGIGLSYRPASLCSLATQFLTRFLELIPCPIAGLNFRLRLQTTVLEFLTIYGARNRVGTRLSYRPAGLHGLGEICSLESILGLLKI
jgi:hypothetical protein